MTENKLYNQEMLELKKKSIDFLRAFFSPNIKSNGKPKIALIPVSGGIDSITLTYLLVESLGKERVVAFHLPNGNTPKTDSDNFELVIDLLGIKYHKQTICDLVESVVRSLPVFKDMNPGQTEFYRAEIPASYYIREAIICAFGKSQEGLYRGVGALDRAEYLTGNYPKNTCTLDVAPLVGMYRQQIRGLASMLGVHQKIVNQLSENDADPECLPIDRLFEKGEIALDTLLFLIYEGCLSDIQIHSLGLEQGVEFNQEEIDLVRKLIKESSHKRNLNIPYPEVSRLGIGEKNLIAAYKEGNMIYGV